MTGKQSVQLKPWTEELLDTFYPLLLHQMQKVSTLQSPTVKNNSTVLTLWQLYFLFTYLTFKFINKAMIVLIGYLFSPGGDENNH